MAYVNQQFFGAITAKSIIKENLIILNGDTTLGSNSITNITALPDYDLSLLRVSQSIYSVSDSISPLAYITNIDLNNSTLTLSSNATSTVIGDTLGFSPPQGTYFFQSCSFFDPNNFLTVNDISGSDQGRDYAVLASAERDGSLIVGRFHIYIISEVVQQDISTSTISFFVQWGESESESDSGDVIRLSELNNAIVDLTDLNDLSPEFSRETPYLENLPIGIEYAAWNIALNNYLSQFQATLILENNVNNYLITATGDNTINGEANLRFDGSTLIIEGSNPTQPKLLITGSGDLVLISNQSQSGVKINDEGITQLLPYSGVPTPIEGGLYYSGSNLFLGIE
jgi:hypothetical protein